MSNIEFEEGSQAQLRRIDISKAASRNTPLLVKWKLVSSVQQANIVMFITFLICIIITIILFIQSQTNSVLYKEDFSPDELERMLPQMRDNLPSKNK